MSSEGCPGRETIHLDECILTNIPKSQPCEHEQLEGLEKKSDATFRVPPIVGHAWHSSSSLKGIQ